MLSSKGFRRVLMCVAYKGEQIVAFVKDGAWLGLQATYSYDAGPESNNLCGTAAAIRQALELLGDYFWVINGDTYLDTSYESIYQCYMSCQPQNLIAAYRNNSRLSTANVDIRKGGGCVYRAHPESRMSYIDAGVALLHRSAFDTSPQVASLSALYEYLGANRRLAAYGVAERFYEINTPLGLCETAKYLGTVDYCHE
jgi:NDP-sugar pyrophosphorylase family protein